MKIQRFECKEDWLAARASRLTSSDVAQCLGIASEEDMELFPESWGTPLQLYLEKRGEAERDIEETDAMRAGLLHEWTIADWFSKETGLKVTGFDQWYLFAGDEPWMASTPDFAIVTNPRLPVEELPSENVKALLEVKCTSERNAHLWADGRAPMHYVVQVQHQMWVTGVHEAYLAVMIGNSDFRYMPIRYNEGFVASMVEQLKRFWEMIEIGVPPNPTPFDRDAVRSLYPVREGERCVLTSHGIDAVNTIRGLKKTLAEKRKDLKPLEDVIHRSESLLRMSMEGAEIGMMPDGTEVVLTESEQPERITPQYTRRGLRFQKTPRTERR